MTICPACGGPDARPSYLGRGRYRDFEYTYLACAACSSLFIDPMPGDALLDVMYDPVYLDEHYAAVLQGCPQDPEMATELERAVRWLTEARPGARVLDVGCGAGSFLTTAKSAGLVPEGYERLAATARVAEQTSAVRVHSGALTSLTPGYDAIHLADVLEHLPRPVELLTTMAHLLVPGGIVVARGPLENQGNLFRSLVVLSRSARARLGRVSPISMPPYHVVLFTAAGWRALLARATLSVQRQEIYEVRWPAPSNGGLRPIKVAKTLSLLVSASPLGRRWRFGNRVISLTSTTPA
jgi:SAM-dependent methyltransferase